MYLINRCPLLSYSLKYVQILIRFIFSFNNISSNFFEISNFFKRQQKKTGSNYKSNRNENRSPNRHKLQHDKRREECRFNKRISERISVSTLFGDGVEAIFAAA